LPNPLIGITTDRSFNKHAHAQLEIPEDYTRAISQAGALPLLIPLGLTAEQLAELVQTLDGILFSGGGDIDPLSYGSWPHPLVTSVDADRDRLEVCLFNLARQAGLPILGICRGLQLFDVAMGGSLYEDLADQRPDTLPHDLSPAQPRDYLAHPVELASGSRLVEILSEGPLQVNSLHHQGINRLADGLRATALAPDGLVEGIEIPDYPFGLAVQWHPECLLEHACMRRLFSAFCTAARSYRDER
jgi:putative glutamine amidotransferase